MGGMGRSTDGHRGVLGLSMSGFIGVRVETQGRCGLLAKKLPASLGEKRSIEMTSSLLNKAESSAPALQPSQTHTPSGSHKSHSCLPPTENNWWKQEPMVDMDMNLTFPSGLWEENYQDLSSWCSTSDTTGYLWPTTDESTAQPVEYQGEIDFDLIKSEEIASIPLQEDSWGSEGVGNMSLNLPPVPEDRWNTIVGLTSDIGSLNPAAKPPEPVLVNDCWLLDIEHEEVVKGESEAGPTADNDPTKIPSQPRSSTLVETKQVQQNLDRRTALASGGFADVRVKVEAEETGSGAFGTPARTPSKPSGKLWSEQRETRHRKTMHSYKKLEQREAQRNPLKALAVPAAEAPAPVVRPKERPASPDLFEEIHRKVVAMTAKSAAAAATTVKRENMPCKPALKQQTPTLPRFDFNFNLDTEPGTGSSSQGFSTPEVLKSFGDMTADGFDLLTYVFDDKVNTPPVPLESGNLKMSNPFHFPQTSTGKPSVGNPSLGNPSLGNPSMGKPNIRDLPGYRTHNPSYQANIKEETKSNVVVVRPMFTKKIEEEKEESLEEKPNSSVVVQVQPQLLPSTATYNEEIQPEPKFTATKRKRQEPVAELTVRIDEPRTTRKKQLQYRRDDDETSLEDEDDDDDDYYMKDDENDEDFTLEPTSKRRKRRTSESSSASKRSRSSVQSSKRNTHERRTSTNENDRYRELRDRNNEASRKSRLTRKAREQELKIREKELVKENQILKLKSEEMENLVKRLREALLQSMMKK